MHIIELHARAADAVRPVLASVTAADLTRLTPCAGWDLATLLAHMAGQDHGFAAAVSATSDAVADVGAFAPRAGAEGLGSCHLDDVVAAFARADPDREVHLAEFGVSLPLPVVVGFHLVDTLVHSWDVAASLGREVRYADDLVAAALAVAEGVPDGEARTAPGAPFGPALPGGTDPWSRTLALLGRDPAWAPVSAARG
ncbi:TIGR03086 family metal-binding protein [Pseudonocardia broussonetiae]|uniref:TIGR03086 family protein n=1 Tax=Pseudonocardia broussonetiae TaxID=2736640 RepID=A0A6M6JN97_9PSEU|nr:TIGR03086 family metal-binding protein [Pseudonocardia broussonetiae]QJY48437.1 TIGR03086 family protein [Pseudonocardia broussonetiae]